MKNRIISILLTAVVLGNMIFLLDNQYIKKQAVALIWNDSYVDNLFYHKRGLNLEKPWFNLSTVNGSNYDRSIVFGAGDFTEDFRNPFNYALGADTQLSGISKDDKTGLPLAVINNRIVSIGSIIEGRTVISIEKDRVKLLEGQKDIILILEN